MATWVKRVSSAPRWQAKRPRPSQLVPSLPERAGGLAVPQHEEVTPIALRLYSALGVVDSFNLDTLRHHDADESFAVVKRSVAESVTEHDGAGRKLQWLRHSDTPLSVQNPVVLARSSEGLKAPLHC
jgi:hypothetical protein